MGWKSILQSVSSGLQIAAPFEPIFNGIPGVNTVFGALFGAVILTENLVGQPSSGQAKKTAAISLIKAAYPDADPAKLGAATDGLVSVLNLLDDAMAPKPAKVPKPPKPLAQKAAAEIPTDPATTPA